MTFFTDGINKEFSSLNLGGGMEVGVEEKHTSPTY